jgi:hypothetical protein
MHDNFSSEIKKILDRTDEAAKSEETDLVSFRSMYSDLNPAYHFSDQINLNRNS